MDNKIAENKKIKPIIEKVNEVESKLKKDDTTEILASAIKSILNKHKN